MTLDEFNANAADAPAQDKTPFTPDMFGVDLSNQTVVSPEQESIQRGIDARGPLDEFGVGVKRGYHGLVGTADASVGLIGKLLGAEPIEKWGMQGYTEHMEDAAKNQAAIQDPLTDIHGLGDGAKYFAGMLGDNLPSLAAFAGGASIGTFAARKLAATLVARATAQELASLAASGVTEGMTAEAAQQLAAQNAVEKMAANLGANGVEGAKKWVDLVGSQAGMTPANLTGSVGGLTGEIYDKTGEVDPGTALAYGLPAAALMNVQGAVEAAPFMKALHPAEGKIAPLLSKQWGINTAKQVGTSAASLGALSRGQTWLEQLGLYSADPNEDPNTDEKEHARNLATFSGGLLGATMGVGGQVFAGTIDSLRAKGAPLTAEALAVKLRNKEAVAPGKVPSVSEINGEKPQGGDSNGEVQTQNGGKEKVTPEPGVTFTGLEDKTPEELDAAYKQLMSDVVTLKDLGQRKDAMAGVKLISDERARRAALQSASSSENVPADGTGSNNKLPGKSGGLPGTAEGNVEVPADVALVPNAPGAVASDNTPGRSGEASVGPEGLQPSLDRPDSGEPSDSAEQGNNRQSHPSAIPGTGTPEQVQPGRPLQVEGKFSHDTLKAELEKPEGPVRESDGRRILPLTEEEYERLPDDLDHRVFDLTFEGPDREPALSLHPQEATESATSTNVSASEKAFEREAKKQGRENIANAEDLKPQELSDDWAEKHGLTEGGEHSQPAPNEDKKVALAFKRLEKFFTMQTENIVGMSDNDPVLAEENKNNLIAAAVRKYQLELRKGRAGEPSTSKIGKTLLTDLARAVEGRRKRLGEKAVIRGVEDDFADHVPAPTPASELDNIQEETALDYLNAKRDSLSPLLQDRIDKVTAAHEDNHYLTDDEHNELKSLISAVRGKNTDAGNTSGSTGEKRVGHSPLSGDQQAIPAAQPGGRTPKKAGQGGNKSGGNGKGDSGSGRQVGRGKSPAKSPDVRPPDAGATGGSGDQQRGGPAGTRPRTIILGEEFLGETGANKRVDTQPRGPGRVQLDKNQSDAANVMLRSFLDLKRRVFGLFMGTGEGKSITILASADQYAKETGKKVGLVVLNKGILDRFQQDAKAMGVDFSKFEVLTYKALGDGTEFSPGVGMVILDESHAVKNSDSLRAIAASKINADHVVLSTATPMDSFVAGAKSLSQILPHLTEEDIFRRIGVEKKPLTGKDGTLVLDKNGDPVFTTVLTEGHSWKSATEELLALRDEALKQGTMYRSFTPFFGEIRTETDKLNDEQREQQSRVIDHYQNEMDGASWNKRRNLAGQLTLELGRLAEMHKREWTLRRIKEELAAGRNPIVIAETAGTQTFKGLDNEQHRGLLSWLGDKLHEEGIGFAEIYGDNQNKKVREGDRFQKGDVRVALGTPASAGVGINLDDSVGNAPRSMILPSVNFSGDVFDQTLGRVSRRNTKSKARVSFLTHRDSISDQRRAETMEKKLGVLRAIQGGTDADVAMLKDSVDQPAPKPKSKKLRSMVPGEPTQAEVSPEDVRRAANLLRGMSDIPIKIDKTDEGLAHVRTDEGVPAGINVNPEEFARATADMTPGEKKAAAAYVVVHERAHIEDMRLLHEDMSDTLGRPPTNLELEAEFDRRSQESHDRLMQTEEGRSLLQEAEDTYPGSEHLSGGELFSELKRMIAEKIHRGETTEEFFRRILNGGDIGLIQWVRRLIDGLKNYFTKAPGIRDSVLGAEAYLEGAMGKAPVDETAGEHAGVLRAKAPKEEPLYKGEGIFAPGGKFNAATRHQLRYMEAAKRAAVEHASGGVRRLTRALEKDFKGKDIPVEALNTAFANPDNHLTDEQYSKYAEIKAAAPEKADEYFTAAQDLNREKYRARQAAAMASLPDATREAMQYLRDSVDRLSDHGIDTGAFTGSLAETVSKNRGTYQHRGYAIFSDKKWADTFKASTDPEIAQQRADMEAYMHNLAIVQRANEIMLADKSISKADAQAIATADPKTAELAGNLFESYMGIGKEGMTALVTGKLPGQMNLSITKLRGQIPEVVRNAWGEYKNPVANFVNTYTGVATFVANHEFLSNIRDIGIKEGWIHDPAAGPHPSGWGKFAGDRKNMGPLHGLFGTPELVEAFKEYAERGKDRDWFTRALSGMTGFASLSKTALSVQSGSRNFTGNFLGAVMNANFFNLVLDPPRAASTFRDALGTVFSKKEKYQASKEEAILLNLKGHGVEAAMTRQLLDQGLGKNDNGSSFIRATKGILHKMTDTYGGLDDFWKIINYKGEMRKIESLSHDQVLSEAKSKGIDLRGVDPEMLHKTYAAEIVRNTTPTYDLAWDINRRIFKKIPFFGPFLTFTLETVRTVQNALKYTMAEIHSPIPEIRKAGYARLAGITMTMLGPSAAAVAARGMLGMGEDDDDALREHLPPWLKNAMILPIKKEGGKVTYLDISFFDMYAQMFKEPLIAALRSVHRGQALGKPVGVVEPAAAFLGQILEPFVNEQIFSSSVIDVLRNSDKDGKPVFNPYDPAKYAQGMVHIAASFVPGTADSMVRMWKAYMGYAEKSSGRTYDPVVETLAPFVGFRPAVVDLENSLGFASYKYAQEKGKAAEILNRELRSRGSTSVADIQSAYQKSVNARDQINDDMRMKILSAEKLGVSPAQVTKILREGNVPAKDTRALTSGNFPDFKASRSLLKRLPADRAQAYRAAEQALATQ